MDRFPFRDLDPLEAVKARTYQSLGNRPGARSPLEIASVTRDEFRLAFGSPRAPALTALARELRRQVKRYRRSLKNGRVDLPELRHELLPCLLVEDAAEIAALHDQGQLMGRLEQALELLEDARQKGRKGGPIPDDRVLRVIIRLAEQFTDLTGLPVTRTITPEGELKGPFFDLVLRGFADFTAREEDARGAIIEAARRWSQSVMAEPAPVNDIGREPLLLLLFDPHRRWRMTRPMLMQPRELSCPANETLSVQRQGMRPALRLLPATRGQGTTRLPMVRTLRPHQVTVLQLRPTMARRVAMPMVLLVPGQGLWPGSGRPFRLTLRGAAHRRRPTGALLPQGEFGVACLAWPQRPLTGPSLRQRFRLRRAN